MDVSVKDLYMHSYQMLLLHGANEFKLHAVVDMENMPNKTIIAGQMLLYR